MLILIILSFLFTQPGDGMPGANVGDSVYVKGFETGGFANAVSLTADGIGAIYVLDAGSNEIVKYDSNLTEIKRAGGPGGGSVQFYSPTYIDASSGLDLLVSDGTNYRVQRLDLKLAFISELATDQSTFLDELQFKTPVATLVVNSNDLYIIDGDNKRVVIFPNGFKPSSSFGGFNSGKGKLTEPVKLLKDNENIIYILDRKKNAIMKYDNFGSYKGSIDPGDIMNFSIYNNVLYILTRDEVIVYDISSGAYTNKFPLPTSVLPQNVTDFLVYSSEKYLLLERNKLSYWILKQ